ncbi:MAG TPA: Asp/Glu racemase [Acidimicrobiia bacterium]|nr:Asp/Glu racemase [Acidimicrobiia bacterium]
MTAATIGFVLPFDSALDREYWRFLPESVDLYLARTPHVSGPLGVDLIAAVSDPDRVLPVARDMAEALDPDIVVYACTSGSFLRGLEACSRLRADMEAAGCRQAGSTSEFLLDALTHLEARTVAVATPYDDEMTGLLVKFLGEAGHDTVSVANLGMTGDPKTVGPEAVLDLALAADSDDADVLFLSCTNLRTFEHIARLEADLGKPVVAANQVSVWGALRRIGAPMPRNDQALFA